MMAALNDDDYVVCTYRGQGEQTAKGIPPEKWWGECLGRATGTCKGKGGTMHITHPEKGIMVTTGVVGSGLPIANGLAMASQNNRYGEHTAYADHTDSAGIAQRAEGYGMKGVRVDGNDVHAMYGAAQDAVDRARAGQGPTLIEAMCYRMMGHFFGADFSYMPPEHIAEMNREDPLPKLRQVMLDHQFTEEELDKMVADINAEIDAAVETALAAPLPDVAELKRDVFEEEMA